MTLDEAARRAGSSSWVESKLFEVLGGWVTSTPEAEAKLLLDRHSQHHAWRAAQWWDRLPLLGDVDRDALVAAPSDEVAAMFEALAQAEGTVTRLAGAYRVALPRLATCYREQREAASPLSDGAILRVLDIVEPDLWSDWREGESCVQTLLVSGDAAEAAARAVARVESLLTRPT